MHSKPKLAMCIVYLILAVTMTAVAADDEMSITRKMTSCGKYNFMLPFRDDYIHTPCIGSHKFHTRAQTWNAARKICEEEGGYLAIINSIAEADVLKNIYETVGPASVVNSPENENYAAIGFHELFKDNEHVTIHGDSLYKAGFARWAPGEPDNEHERCGSFHISGGLNDIDCDSRFPFFCELR